MQGAQHTCCVGQSRIHLGELQRITALQTVNAAFQTFQTAFSIGPGGVHAGTGTCGQENAQAGGSLHQIRPHGSGSAFQIGQPSGGTIRGFEGVGADALHQVFCFVIELLPGQQGAVHTGRMGTPDALGNNGHGKSAGEQLLFKPQLLLAHPIQTDSGIFNTAGGKIIRNHNTSGGKQVTAVAQRIEIGDISPQKRSFLRIGDGKKMGSVGLLKISLQLSGDCILGLRGSQGSWGQKLVVEQTIEIGLAQKPAHTDAAKGLQGFLQFDAQFHTAAVAFLKAGKEILCVGQNGLAFAIQCGETPAGLLPAHQRTGWAGQSRRDGSF